MAAPVVTGVIALMLSEARAKGKDLNANDIRSLLTDNARPKGTG
jgi:hypothetical protein